MRTTITASAAGLALALAVPFVCAPDRPAAAQEENLDEAAAYQAWFFASAAKESAATLRAAESYLKAFPTGAHADYLRKWIATERGAALNAAIKAKNTAEIVRIGRQVLAGDPDNLNVLYALALNIRQNELFGSPADYTHAKDAVEFSSQAIKLIEAGKTLAGVDPSKWSKDQTLAWLYQNLAVVEAKDANVDKALALYEKSSALDPADARINAYNLLACGSLRKSKYDDAVQAYQAFPEAERQAAEPKPEVKAVVDRANTEADALIDCWSRFLGLAQAKGLSPETQGKVMSILEGLYRNRHPEDPSGLQKVIEKHRAEIAAPAAKSPGS
jgi:tetratricopeptide (TPR) repeat protein